MVAYVPLLTLLLPEKISAVAGAARVEWLGAATIAGALSASAANIAFGWASDVIGTRRLWIGMGLACTVGAYGLLHGAATPALIVAAVVGYQVGLNMMLSPLAAWAADSVPDAQKGRLAGLLGAAPPVAALAGVLATSTAMPGGGAQLALVCAMVAALVLPLLLLGRPRVMPATAPAGSSPPRRRRADLALLWLSRLLVQVAGSVLFAYLLYYFQSLRDGALTQAGVARLAGVTNLLALPLALAVGWTSDRVAARTPFLVGAAAAMSAGLAAMAFPPDPRATVAGYVLFGCGFAVFLNLHSVFAMQLLPSPRRRGRDLGLFNLTNTLPAILSPLLAVALVKSSGFEGLLATLAALTGAAALMLLLVRERRSTA